MRERRRKVVRVEGCGSQSWPRSLFRIWHQNLNVRNGLLITVALESTSEPQALGRPRAARPEGCPKDPNISPTLKCPELSDLHLPGNPPDGHAAQEQALEPGDSTSSASPLDSSSRVTSHRAGRSQGRVSPGAEHSGNWHPRGLRNSPGSGPASRGPTPVTPHSPGDPLA